MRLINYTKTEPQAAFAAFTYDIKKKWNYTMRAVLGISTLMGPLQEAFINIFLLEITYDGCPRNQERRLLELPPRMDGLGITNPQVMAQTEHENSFRLPATPQDIL